jgi:hypothetical protein
MVVIPKNIGMLYVGIIRWLYIKLRERHLNGNTSVLVEMVTRQQSLCVELTLILVRNKDKFNINSTEIQHKFNKSY